MVLCFDFSSLKHDGKKFCGHTKDQKCTYTAERKIVEFCTTAFDDLGTKRSGSLAGQPHPGDSFKSSGSGPAVAVALSRSRCCTYDECLESPSLQPGSGCYDVTSLLVIHSH